jgi:RNA polymerase sigma-70 factor (ECF subfamily)
MDLIQRARDGDEAALGALLKAYRVQLRQLADQALPDRLKARVDASDIVQQTSLSVFRQIAEFQGDDPAQFAAWLRQIHERNIQNAVRDQLQTQKRGDGLEDRFAGQDVEATSQLTPSRQAMQREESRRLAQVLEQLPEDEREVLRLRYLEGRTLVQVCDELGRTKDAVVWLMQKGMKRLRQWLPRTDEHP